MLVDYYVPTAAVLRLYHQHKNCQCKSHQQLYHHQDIQDQLQLQVCIEAGRKAIFFTVDTSYFYLVERREEVRDRQMSMWANRGQAWIIQCQYGFQFIDRRQLIVKKY